MKASLFFFTIFWMILMNGTMWDHHIKLAFDDVLLKPQYSEIRPSEVSTSARLTPNIPLSIPVCSAAMGEVTESCLAISLAENGGIGIIHSDMSIEDQCYHVRTVKNFKTNVIKSSPHSRNNTRCTEPPLLVGAAIAVDNDSQKRITALAKEQVNVIVINAIHGHTKEVIDLICWSKRTFPSLEVIAGNIATAEGARALVQAGVDAVKVGIGPGAHSPVCRFSGVGVPQISAIREVAHELVGKDIPIIADGGIQTSGDLCKALAAGADTVMIGTLFCNTQESPADIALYKSTSTDEAEEQTQLQCNTTVQEVTTQLMNGLRSCMALIGCQTIAQMHTSAHFIRITDAAMLESY